MVKYCKKKSTYGNSNATANYVNLIMTSTVCTNKGPWCTQMCALQHFEVTRNAHFQCWCLGMLCWTSEAHNYFQKLKINFVGNCCDVRKYPSNVIRCQITWILIHMKNIFKVTFLNQSSFLKCLSVWAIVCRKLREDSGSWI